VGPGWCSALLRVPLERDRSATVARHKILWRVALLQLHKRVSATRATPAYRRATVARIALARWPERRDGATMEVLLPTLDLLRHPRCGGSAVKAAERCIWSIWSIWRAALTRHQRLRATLWQLPAGAAVCAILRMRSGKPGAGARPQLRFGRKSVFSE
jgi:hypothetical protein